MPAQPPPQAQANVQFSLTVPRVAAGAARSARFIASSVRSGAVRINGGSPQIVELTAGSPGCTAAPSGITCTFTLAAAPGNDTFAVALYDGSGASGTLLATGTSTATVVAGIVNTVGITVGGIVANVALALATTTPVQGTPATIPLTVTATDPDGNTIVGDPYAAPIALTNSDGSGATLLSTSTVSEPGQAINLTYSGAPLHNATLSATVAGAQVGVAPAVLTPKTESTVGWTTFQFNAQRTGYNPSETVCCRSAPVQIWATTLGDPYLVTQPLFADNVFTPRVAGGAYVDLVYVGDNHGNLYALDAADGSIVWSRALAAQVVLACADIPDKTFGITGTPALDRSANRLYVVDGAGLLWALDPATGALAAGWPAGGVRVVDNPVFDHVYSAITLDLPRHTLYVPTASYCDIGNNHGSLRSVDLTSANVIADFWFGATTGLFGGGMWGFGGVALDPISGDVFGASANMRGAPNAETALYSDMVIRWASQNVTTVLQTFRSPLAEPDDDFGASPSLFPDPAGGQCAAVQKKDGVLYVFDVGNGGLASTQMLGVGGPTSEGFNLAEPGYDPVTRMVYLGNAVDGPLPHGVYAFNVHAGPGAGLVSASGRTEQLHHAGDRERRGVHRSRVAGRRVRRAERSAALAFRRRDRRRRLRRAHRRRRDAVRRRVGRQAPRLRAAGERAERTGAPARRALIA